MDRETAQARVHADPATGIIQVGGEGFWAPEEISVILDRLATLVAQAHARKEPALVLVSLGDNGAQMKDTVQRLQERSASIYLRGDRLAVVAHSTLLKMQVARVERVAQYRLFDNKADAESWLLSPTLPG